MSDPTEPDQPETRPRGEAAWKEAKEFVERRNAEAKKAGRERRDNYERQRETMRRSAEGREMARFMASRRTP